MNYVGSGSSRYGMVGVCLCGIQDGYGDSVDFQELVQILQNVFLVAQNFFI